MRDNFSSAVKEVLAKRVGYRCSNPSCRGLTSGPQSDPMKTVNVGVAAHMSAASPGGPRYDDSLTPEERCAAGNGVWLCQKCGKLVDSDAERYPLSVLHAWKKQAEDAAIREIEGAAGLQSAPTGHDRSVLLARLDKMMPKLLGEMRKDLEKFPFRREFVVLERAWLYWARGHELAYFHDDHDELLGKLQILKSHNLISEITFNGVKRFLISEELADYLGQKI